MIAALLAAAVPVAPAWSGPIGEYRLQQKVKEGIQLYRDGQYDKALEIFTQAQTENWQSPELTFGEAVVLASKKEVEKARTLFSKVAACGDKSLEALARYNLGRLDLDAGKPQEALEQFKKTLQIDPSDRDAKHNLELATMQLQKPSPSPQPSPQSSPNSSPSPQSSPSGQQQPSPSPSSDPSASPQSSPDPSSNPSSSPSPAGSPSSSAGASPSPSPGSSASASPAPQSSPSPAGSASAAPASAAPDPNKEKAKEAQQLLRALEDDEKKNLREMLLERAKAKGERSVEKDW